MSRIRGSLFVNQEANTVKFVPHEPGCTDVRWHLLEDEKLRRSFLEKFIPQCSVQADGQTIYAVDCSLAELERWLEQVSKSTSE